ncbi:hypothetical protein [Natronococcus amylolyticus]|uniref:hypothetical protein n=1 Tax=Natronococcus amylolyticus TaxID=44470 RepID=UPI00126797B2|nr:hypothetical protein [Natronococcus amylolyticus]
MSVDNNWSRRIAVQGGGAIQSRSELLLKLAVDVGRDGEPLLVCGKHRFAVASLLGASHVPVLFWLDTSSGWPSGIASPVVRPSSERIPTFERFADGIHSTEYRCWERSDFLPVPSLWAKARQSGVRPVVSNHYCRRRFRIMVKEYERGRWMGVQ